MDSDMRVVWSARAKITYFDILDYLENNWTKKELIRFNQRTEIILKAITKNPGIFPVSSKHKKIRKAVIDKNNSCFYKIDSYNKKIYLLTFFDNRRNPEKLTLKT